MNHSPKFELHKIHYKGASAVELVIRYANAELRALADKLGYKRDDTIANRRAIICTNQDQVDAARDPLIPFFNADGEYNQRD